VCALEFIGEAYNNKQSNNEKKPHTHTKIKKTNKQTKKKSKKRKENKQQAKPNSIKRT
jgi:hypothetical protein